VLGAPGTAVPVTSKVKPQLGRPKAQGDGGALGIEPFYSPLLLLLITSFIIKAWQSSRSSAQSLSFNQPLVDEARVWSERVARPSGNVQDPRADRQVTT